MRSSVGFRRAPGAGLSAAGRAPALFDSANGSSASAAVAAGLGGWAAHAGTAPPQANPKTQPSTPRIVRSRLIRPPVCIALALDSRGNTGPGRLTLLWHGLPTVPLPPTAGLLELRETFGRAGWHGRET